MTVPGGGRRALVLGGLAALVMAGAVVAAVDGDDVGGSGDLVGAPLGGSFELDGAGPPTTVAGADEFAAAPHAALTAGAGGGGGEAARAPADTGGADVASRPASQAVDPAGPRVVKRAELRVEVSEGRLADAVGRATTVAETLGGFVVSSATSSDDEGPGAADLVLRVPSDRFDSARADLSKLGDVKSVRVSGEDVSGQLVDLDARLRALRAEEEATLALLAETNDIGQILLVRDRLSATRSQIEQLAAQQAALEDAATFATISVALFEPGDDALLHRPDEERSGLARSLERAVDGAADVAGGMIVVVGYLLPIAVLAALVLLVGRLRRRRPATA